MKLRIGLIDSSEKRWFGKVAWAAEKALNDLIKPIGGDVQLEFHTHFDTSESDRVGIVDYREGKISCTQIVFAAKEWQTVSDSIPRATAQLATALMALAPVEVRPQLVSLFNGAFPLLPIRRSCKSMPSDGLIDFYLYIEQSMEVDAFFALIDRIDCELCRQGVGMVSGNVYGLNAAGSCIDLVGTDRKKVQAIVNEEVRASGIGQYRFDP
jgi:hypothetical protein